MGLERKTRGRHKKLEAFGTLHLDSQSLAFRSKELKWSVDLGTSVTAQATDGWLVVQVGRDKLEFEVGADSAKWVEKILHPPSRLDKLGVKPSMKYWLGGKFDKGFLTELARRDAIPVKSVKDCQIAFLLIQQRYQFSKLTELAERLPDQVNLWIVWPKGVEAIRQSDVLETAAACGMGPSKTASFDSQHSSMRFARQVNKFGSN